jgi:hypothetical protein
VTAAWIRSPEDIGREFEFSLHIFISPDDTDIDFGVRDFVFASDHQRISLKLAGFGFQVSGTMRVVVGLRERGSQEWEHVQTYPILLEDVTPAVVSQPAFPVAQSNIQGVKAPAQGGSSSAAT